MPSVNAKWRSGKAGVGEVQDALVAADLSGGLCGVVFAESISPCTLGEVVEICQAFLRLFFTMSVFAGVEKLQFESANQIFAS